MAVNWLNSNPQEPFYTHIYRHWPHKPYGDRKVILPDGFSSKTIHYEPIPLSYKNSPESIYSTRRKYDADIYYTDIQIGIILNAIKENKYIDNTIVIFTSDHGEDMGERIVGAQPFFNHSYWLYESSTAVPLIFVFPHKELGGEHVYFPVSSVDIFPTLLSLLNIPVPSAAQGEMLFNGSIGSLKINNGLMTSRPYVFAFNFLYGKEHPGLDGYKKGKDFSGVFSQRYILQRTEQSMETELYDIKSDYHSTKNISDNYPEIREELNKKLNEWLEINDFSHSQAMIDNASPKELPERIKRKLRALGYLR